MTGCYINCSFANILPYNFKRTMETSYSNYAEAALDARCMLDHEREKLIEKLTLMENFGHLLDSADDMITTIKKQQEEIDNLRQQLADEKRQRVDVETKLAEMSKLSAGMAKKADQDDFHKALRIFLNISRRKTIGKREAAKNVITDLMTTAKLELPDDIMELLEHLDDEQTEPKTVTVNGSYNDIHDNGGVTLNRR